MRSNSYAMRPNTWFWILYAILLFVECVWF
jgi:hypothetical protein